MEMRHIGDLLYLVSKEMRREVELRLQNENLNYTQFQALMAIKRYDNGVSQEEISHILEIDKSNVSRSVRRLSEGGWIDVHVDQEDARRTLLTLTEKSEEKLKSLQHLLFEVESKMLRNIPSDDQKRVSQLLEDVLSNLRKDNE
ncbi:MAG: MarR family transcriptional regulator [Erysipelotrichaceae bacterium]|nr:MarR family transcriptional regulator [Erysipelotrichaceae bacterium]